MQKATNEVDKLAQSSASDVRSVAVVGPGLSSFLFSSTRVLLAGGLTTAVLLFFLLRSGDLFLRRFVETLPTLANKKQAVGIMTGIAAYFCGLSDAAL